MKRMIMIAVIGLLAMAPTWGQVKLQIDSVEFMKLGNVNKSTVLGSSLSKYKLESFKSFKFQASEEELEKVEQWIRNDAQKAADSDLEADGDRLVYALLRFGTDGSKKNYYVGYQTKGNPQGASVTIVKMYGKASTEDLKYFFKQK